jgi:hypothetical protein
MSDHGTPAGHRAGCKGNLACPNHGTSLPTCLEAGIRYAGDYTYRQRVERGYSPVDILMLEQADIVTLKASKTPARAPVKRTRSNSIIPRRSPSNQLVHGTPYGYSLGCRNPATCTAALNGERSCTEANRDRMREYKRRSRAKGLK